MVNYISGDKFTLNQNIKSELEKFILH